IFLLNGEELFPCTNNTLSPGCTNTDGTTGSNFSYYATKHEKYLRIKRDSTADTFYVWDKDGRKSTYTPLRTTGSGTYSYALTTVADTRGNQVNYAGWCDGGEACYLDNITYNGVTIKVPRDPGTRNDRLQNADGNSLENLKYLYEGVDVLVMKPGDTTPT